MRDLKESIHSNFPATTSAQIWLAAKLYRLYCSRGNPSPIHGSRAWDPPHRVGRTGRRRADIINAASRGNRKKDAATRIQDLEDIKHLSTPEEYEEKRSAILSGI